jgi:hypothetical protein
MFDHLTNSPSSNVLQIAAAFRRLGWIGFWLQALLGFIPFVILIFVLFFNPNGGGFDLKVILAYGCLLALVFTIYWCYRYTRLANKLENSKLRPSKEEVTRSLWIGLLANVGGMSCAVLVAIWLVGTLLFKMLSLPQGATTIAPTRGSEGTVISPGQIVVPNDLIAMQAMVITVAAELIGIIVALLLLYRVSQNRSR